MKQVPFQIRQQITPTAANAFASVEMLNNYLNKDKRKGLVIQTVELELETDLEYADSDEFLVQIVTQEFAAEAFYDDKDVKFKRKPRIALTTSGKIILNQVWSWSLGKRCIIPTEKFWIQFQTVGQSAAIVANVVLHCKMGFLDQTAWNRITSPD